MKKIISMVCVLLLVVTTLPYVVMADEGTHVLGVAQVTVETNVAPEDILNDYIHPGATVEVAVKGDISNIASMIFSVTCQCEGIEVSKPDITKNTMGGNLYYNESNNQFIWIASDLKTEVTNQGVFATFSVTLPEIKGTKKIKELVINTEVIDASTQYEDFSEEYVTKVNDEKVLKISHFWDEGVKQEDDKVKYTCTKDGCGEFVITDGKILGDVDNNGEIGSSDVTALARHVAKLSIIEDSSILENCCDTNKDGRVTSDDITQLARFVAKIITEL